MSLEEFVLKFRKEIISVIIFLVITSIVSLTTNSLFQPVKAQDIEKTIGVTAVVEYWLDFSVSPTSTLLSPPLVQADGTLNIGSSTVIALTLGTNAPAGWQVTIKGQHAGLYSSKRNYRIPTVTATSTLTPGTEGYGANATGILSGVTIGPYYNYYGTNIVGEIVTSTSRLLASKSTPNSTQSVANMKVKAAASDVTTPPSDDYSDTITLTASGMM